MVRSRTWSTFAAVLLLVLLVGSPAAAQSAVPTLRLDVSPDIRFFTEVRVRAFRMPSLWDDSKAVKLPRYRFMADPRRWPRLFASTTECTLSLNPVTRRHWWQG